MPGKRNELPYPCPKCGSPYGTVQIVFFNKKRKVTKKSSRYEAWNKYPRPTHRWNGSYDNSVFRIGHYDSASYEKTKKENNKIDNFQTDETKKQKLRTSQRRWCSFRSEILLQEKFWDYDRVSKTTTLPFYDDLWEQVFDEGWKMIQKR